MLVYVIYVFLFIALGGPLLRYTGFIISNWRAGTLGDIRKRFNGLLFPLLKGVWTAGLADLFVIPLYPLGFLGGKETLGEDTPVLLVHGLFHNASAWLIMKHRLREAGIVNVHTYQYGTMTGDFQGAVDGLRARLDVLLRRHPGGTVALVGHSLGGLVIRKAIGDPRYWDRIAGVVTLGSPHGGSDLAHCGFNAMARGLLPGGAIPVAASAAPDAHCPRLSLFSPVDDFVYPFTSLQVNREGWEESLCSPMSHVWMLYSREISGIVIDFLRGIGCQADDSGDSLEAF